MARKGVRVPSIVPQCPSMLIARDVQFDPVTGQASILGVLHRLSMRRFPSSHPGVVVWAELTGGRGAVALTLAVIRLDRRTMEEHVMTTVRLQGQFGDPRRVHMVRVTVADIPLSEPGVMLFRLASEGV